MGRSKRSGGHRKILEDSAWTLVPFFPSPLWGEVLSACPRSVIRPLYLFPSLQPFSCSLCCPGSSVIMLHVSFPVVPGSLKDKFHPPWPDIQALYYQAFQGHHGCQMGLLIVLWYPWNSFTLCLELWIPLHPLLRYPSPPPWCVPSPTQAPRLLSRKHSLHLDMQVAIYTGEQSFCAVSLCHLKINSYPWAKWHLLSPTFSSAFP